MTENRLDPSDNNAVRKVLRVAGPVTAGLGLILIGIGMVSFFSSFGSFSPPR